VRWKTHGAQFDVRASLGRPAADGPVSFSEQFMNKVVELKTKEITEYEAWRIRTPFELIPRPAWAPAIHDLL
jgi:hypothetical protein